jgi:hypothetical protein
MQYAIWKMEYDTVNFADPASSFNDPNSVLYIQTPPNSLGFSSNVFWTAVQLIKESANQNDLAMVLTYDRSDPNVFGQETIYTQSFNFTNVDPPAGKITAGDTATIGFWANQNGQALLTSVNGGPNATNLASWLSGNFPNLFPTSLIGTTNQSVAAYFKQLKGQSGNKLEAQIMAVAFATYVTSSNLAGGSYAAAYGFNVTPSGIQGFQVTPGSSGAALGISSNTAISVITLLHDADALAVGGSLFAGNNTKRGSAVTIFNDINTTGDI